MEGLASVTRSRGWVRGSHRAAATRQRARAAARSGACSFRKAQRPFHRKQRRTPDSALYGLTMKVCDLVSAAGSFRLSGDVVHQVFFSPSLSLAPLPLGAFALTSGFRPPISAFCFLLSTLSRVPWSVVRGLPSPSPISAFPLPGAPSCPPKSTSSACLRLVVVSLARKLPCQTFPLSRSSRALRKRSLRPGARRQTPSSSGSIGKFLADGLHPKRWPSIARHLSGCSNSRGSSTSRWPMPARPSPGSCPN